MITDRVATSWIKLQKHVLLDLWVPFFCTFFRVSPLENLEFSKFEAVKFFWTAERCPQSASHLLFGHVHDFTCYCFSMIPWSHVLKTYNLIAVWVYLTEMVGRYDCYVSGCFSAGCGYGLCFHLFTGIANYSAKCFLPSKIADSSISLVSFTGAKVGQWDCKIHFTHLYLLLLNSLWCQNLFKTIWDAAFTALGLHPGPDSTVFRLFSPCISVLPLVGLQSWKNHKVCS